jgi:hypothetical protein
LPSLALTADAALSLKVANPPTLDFIQQAVGGSIEIVPHFIKYEGRRVTAVCASGLALLLMRHGLSNIATIKAIFASTRRPTLVRELHDEPRKGQ